MSTHQEHADLTGLVAGELGNAEVVRARAHLQTCETCRAELVDLVAGHALVSRTATTLAADLAPRTGDRSGEATIRPAHEEQTPPLPPLRRPSPLVRHRVPLLAAAAALVVGAAVTGVLVRGGDDAPPEDVQVARRSATLEPVEGDGTGTVSMTSRPGKPAHMVIETSDLPALDAGQFYYAWLLDPATNKMLPLGQVWPDGSTTFDVDESLVGSYSAVDVSLEEDDGDPQHSPVSVLRATYA